MDCIFCKIARGEQEVRKIYEDEYVVSFEDRNPIANVHILTIPKKHITSLLELQESDKDTLWHIHHALQQVAMKTGVHIGGFRVITNTGNDSEQTIPHIHYHLIGGQDLEWKAYGTEESTEPENDGEPK